jgi:hypothetical protein
MSSIDELLAALSALRAADIRLAIAPAGTPERAAIMREIHRLERIAFADVFRPAPERSGQSPAPNVIL